MSERGRKSGSGRPAKNTGASDPRYIEIANSLRQELLAGKFKPGQRFYSIRRLIHDTKRSLPTVRSAVDILVKEDFLEARPGSGFYVTDKVEDVSSKALPNLLTVMPSYAGPSEPWFTGRIFSGMIKAAEESRAVVSYYQRKIVHNPEPEDTQIDLERILSTRPGGIAWLHTTKADAPLLRELISRQIPIVTTMRSIEEFQLPLLREDNLVFASLVLSQFQARGHRRLAVILRDRNEEYFASKLSALGETAQSLNMELRDDDFYVMKTRVAAKRPAYKKDAVELEQFLRERPEITGIINLASEGLYPLLFLMESSFRDYLRKISLLHNVLDGVYFPPLPTGETLATIAPPLETLGEQLVKYLVTVIRGEPPPELPPLIPVFSPGSSLKPASDS